MAPCLSVCLPQVGRSMERAKRIELVLAHWLVLCFKGNWESSKISVFPAVLWTSPKSMTCATWFGNWIFPWASFSPPQTPWLTSSPLNYDLCLLQRLWSLCVMALYKCELRLWLWLWWQQSLECKFGAAATGPVLMLVAKVTHGHHHRLHRPIMGQINWK